MCKVGYAVENDMCVPVEKGTNTKTRVNWHIQWLDNNGDIITHVHTGHSVDVFTFSAQCWDHAPRHLWPHGGCEERYGLQTMGIVDQNGNLVGTGNCCNALAKSKNKIISQTSHAQVYGRWLRLKSPGGVAVEEISMFTSAQSTTRAVPLKTSESSIRNGRPASVCFDGRSGNTAKSSNCVCHTEVSEDGSWAGWVSADYGLYLPVAKIDVYTYYQPGRNAGYTIQVCCDEECTQVAWESAFDDGEQSVTTFYPIPESGGASCDPTSTKTTTTAEEALEVGWTLIPRAACDGGNEICWASEPPCNTATNNVQKCAGLCSSDLSCVSFEYEISSGNCQLSTTCTDANKDSGLSTWQLWVKKCTVSGIMYGPSIAQGIELFAHGYKHATEENLYIFAVFDDKYIKMTGATLDAARSSTSPASPTDKYVEVGKANSGMVLDADLVTKMWDGTYTIATKTGAGYEVKDVRVSCGSGCKAGEDGCQDTTTHDDSVTFARSRERQYCSQNTVGVLAQFDQSELGSTDGLEACEHFCSRNDECLHCSVHCTFENTKCQWNAIPECGERRDSSSRAWDIAGGISTKIGVPDTTSTATSTVTALTSTTSVATSGRNYTEYNSDHPLHSFKNCTNLASEGISYDTPDYVYTSVGAGAGNAWERCKEAAATIPGLANSTFVPPTALSCGIAPCLALEPYPFGCVHNTDEDTVMYYTADDAVKYYNGFNYNMICEKMDMHCEADQELRWSNLHTSKKNFVAVDQHQPEWACRLSAESRSALAVTQKETTMKKFLPAATMLTIVCMCIAGYVTGDVVATIVVGLRTFDMQTDWGFYAINVNTDYFKHYAMYGADDVYGQMRPFDDNDDSWTNLLRVSDTCIYTDEHYYSNEANDDHSWIEGNEYTCTEFWDESKVRAFQNSCLAITIIGTILTPLDIASAVTLNDGSGASFMSLITTASVLFLEDVPQMVFLAKYFNIMPLTSDDDFIGDPMTILSIIISGISMLWIVIMLVVIGCKLLPNGNSYTIRG